MKNFLYTTKNIEKNKKLWFSKVKTRIYEVKRNKPNYIWTVERVTGATKGEDSEVLNRLVELWYLPKKELLRSEWPWRGAGYYVADNWVYTITEI